MFLAVLQAVAATSAGPHGITNVVEVLISALFVWLAVQLTRATGVKTMRTALAMVALGTPLAPTQPLAAVAAVLGLAVLCAVWFADGELLTFSRGTPAAGRLADATERHPRVWPHSD